MSNNVLDSIIVSLPYPAWLVYRDEFRWCEFEDSEIEAVKDGGEIKTGLVVGYGIVRMVVTRPGHVV
jgi:hypothetical protein